MKTFQQLIPTWSNNNANYIPNFKKIFPELKHVSGEDLCDRFIELGLDFYTNERTPVKFWIRFTLPFAIALIIIMILSIPFNFLIRGEWSYSIGKNNYIFNWFKSLKLIQ
jgi:hypothetical protein